MGKIEGIRLVLGASVLLQFAAAVLAFRLVRITRKRLAWGLIATAITLMAVRRSITCYRTLVGETALQPDAQAEWVALIISVLMTLGVASIAPFFLSASRSAEQLELSEHRLRKAQEVAHLGFWEWDIIKDTVYWSDETYRIFGLTPDDSPPTYATFLSAVHPDDRNHVQENADAAVHQDRTYAIDHRIIRPDGVERYVHGIGDVLRDDNGVPIKMVGTLHDITARKQIEEELRSARERLDLAVKGSTDGLWDWNIETGRNWLSPRWKALLGYEPDEISDEYDEWESHAHPDDLAHTRHAVRQHLEQDVPYDVEHRLRTKSGNYRWFRTRGVAIRDQNGKPIRMAGSTQDITEHKAAENALLSSEARLRAILNAAADAIITIDPNGIIESFNRAAQEIFGYTSKEAIGLNVNALMPEPFHTEHDGYLEKCLATGNTSIIDSRREVVGKRKNGQTFPMDLHVSDVRLADRRLFSAIVQDISDRKRAEESLKTRARQQATVAELGQSALAGANLGDFMDHTVHRLAETLDIEFSKILELLPGGSELRLRAGVGWRDGLVSSATIAVHENSQAGFTLKSRAPVIVEDLRTEPRFAGPRLLRDHGVISGMSVIIQGRDGPWGILGAHTKKLRRFTENDVHFLQAVANVLAEAMARTQDEESLRQAHASLETRVTQRTTELKFANQELEAFTYSVSHDLRAPLRHIDGFIRILMEDHAPELEPEAARCLETIRTSAAKMATLIDNLLTLSRLGRQPLTRQRVDTQEMVESVWHELNADAKNNPFNFKAFNLPPVQADAALLKQVWLNLLGNAKKYSLTCNSPRISVDSYQKQGIKWYRIRDNGVGFDPKYADKLFGPFQRLHREDEFPGTGIGLAIVRRIVQKHGGRIHGDAKVGRGAVFEFTLGGTA